MLLWILAIWLWIRAAWASGDIVEAIYTIGATLTFGLACIANALSEGILVKRKGE